MQNSDNCYATLKNPIHRLTGHDSSTPTDTTPKSSGVAPPRYAAACQVAPPSVAAIQNQTATAPGQHGVPCLTRRLDDQRNKPAALLKGRHPRATVSAMTTLGTRYGMALQTSATPHPGRDFVRYRCRGGGVLHMSVALYCTLRQWGGVNQKLSARGKGALQAAKITHCNIPPMRVLGSARIPIVFTRRLRTQHSS